MKLEKDKTYEFDFCGLEKDKTYECDFCGHEFARDYLLLTKHGEVMCMNCEDRARSVES